MVDVRLPLLSVLLAACAEQRPPPVEYVNTADWKPAPQVSEMEAKSAGDRGLVQATPIQLHKHQPIPETTATRTRRRR